MATACARLQLGQKVADVRLDRLLREEEALADLPVDKPVGDELEDFDLAIRRLLLELAERRRELDDLGALAPVRTGGRLVEAPGVVQVAREDVLTLGGVH